MLPSGMTAGAIGAMYSLFKKALDEKDIDTATRWLTNMNISPPNTRKQSRRGRTGGVSDAAE